MNPSDNEHLAKVAGRLGRELEEWLKDKTVEPHYSIETAAELLEVSKVSIRRHIEAGQRSQGKEGIYPVVKLSYKVIRIPASALNRFLGRHTIAIQPAKAA